MSGLRSRWALGVLVWTVALVVAAVVFAVVAMASLYEAQQACFFAFPSVPCPDEQDWRVGLLTFAFVGIPCIWVVGLVVAVAVRAAVKGQRERH